MPEPQADRPRTRAEFRAWRARRPGVRELIHGLPKPTAPGSTAPTLIKRDAGRRLGSALDRTGGRGFVDGAIVEAHAWSSIPETVVTSAPLDLSTPRVDEPLSLVERLWPSTRNDDIGRKLALDLEIPSLRHHLAIHQERRQGVHHQRRDGLGGVFLTDTGPPDPLRLEPPGIETALAAIDEGVPLD